MQSVNKRLEAIKEVFPGQDDRIEKLYKKSEDFRELCADYLLCVSYLQQFQQEFMEKQHSLEEYTNLGEKLEGQISDYILNAVKPHAASGSRDLKQQENPLHHTHRRPLR